MEPAEAWGPCEFRLENWAGEEPDAGLPMEYASIDIPGTCGGQQQQLLEYYAYYSAVSTHNATSDQAKISNDSRARSVVNQVLGEFRADIKKTKEKMHRFPASLEAVDKSYTVPRIVAIGPYHHDLEKLKQVEKVKHVAACHCVRDSGRLLEEVYGAVASVADDVRCLYDKDVMAGIGYDDFRHMMFFDACFLVQYMVLRGSTHDEIDESLLGFLRPNRGDIFRDVMLLENQLPWKVVETVLRFMPGEPSISRKFVVRMRHCMRPDRFEHPKEKPSVEWDEDYKPPHLLSLLRYYIVGRRSDTDNLPTQRTQYVSLSVSAMELGRIGITLAANKTGELIDMDLINQKGTLFPELSLAPLSLSRRRASYLVNMAALELCTIGSFSRAPSYEDSAVCSYLMLLSMLVCREEDVQELRIRGLLLGGRGLTNEEGLRFFTSFHGLRLGPYYFDIMRQIEIYRDGNRMKTKLLAIFHSHKKTIAAVLTGIGAVGGIIGTLLSIKKAV